jgi:PAS domain S-box-containing protein
MWRTGDWPSHALSAGLVAAAAAAAGLTVLRLLKVVVQAAHHDRAASEKYLTLVENIPDIVWTMDAQGNVLFISAVVEKMLGYTAEDVDRLGAGQIWIASLHPDDAPGAQAAFERLFLKREPYDVECRVRRKDGEWIWVHNRSITTYDRAGVRYADGLMSDITSRKRAEEALRVKEAEYRRLVSNLPDVTWSASVDARIPYVSPNVEHVLGYTAEDYCERGEELWLGRIHPADSRRVLDAFGALFSDNRPFDVEYRVQHKDGEWIWIHDRAIRTYVKDGVRFADGMFSDITARKRVEEALKELASGPRPDERKDRLLVEEIPALTYMVPVDPPGRPIYVSPQATARLGIAPQEWNEVPDLWRALVHPEDRDRVDREIAEVVKTGRRLHLDYRVAARDGRVLWVHDEATLAPGAPGQPRTLRGVLLDITDVKAAEEALEASERRYRLVAENVSDVIWTADLELRRTYVSPSVTRLLGFAPDELVGQSIYASAGPVVAAAGQKILEEELAAERAGRADPFAARVTEVPTRRKDGSAVWVEVKTNFIRDRSGAPVGILGMTRDITERRQAEQAKSDFITFATHQLRTPLTGIKWLLEIAALQPDVGAEMSSYLGGAQASADRMIALVNDLLDASRLERRRGEVKTEPTDLAALTRSLLAEVGPLAGLRRQRLSVHGDQAPVIALAEPALLRQAMINLVANAIKFTPEEGTIDIRLSGRKGEVRWEIQDSGIGIPAAAQAHLFEKFYRADNAVKLAPEGTGLGLHLVRLIIDQLGGRVWFRSEEGHGTTFTFTLPTPVEVSDHG